MTTYQDRFRQIQQLWGMSGTCGHSRESLEPWFTRYGAVPAALLEYCTTLGAHRELNESQDALVVPDDAAGSHKLARVPATDHLVFYVENQWALLWGIAPGDVEEPDPMVHVSGDGAEWESLGESVSAFLLAQAHMQRVISYEHTSEEHWDLRAEALAAIRARFPLLVSSAMYEGTAFYGVPGEIVMVNQGREGITVWFGAEDEERLDALFDFFEELDEGAE